MPQPKRSSPSLFRVAALLRRALGGLLVAGVALAAGELALRMWVPEAQQPAPIDRFALADVAAGAYVHRRDSVAGDWLEVVDGRVRTRPSRRPEGVATVDVTVDPEPGVHRIVALGGSTTRGVPFDHLGGGFVAELTKRLPSLSDASFEVVNLGVPGMDARGVATLAEEARQLHASTWVLYTGNNEVMGDLLDRCVRSERLLLARTLDRLLGYRLLRRQLLGVPALPTGADAIAAQEACTGARIAEAWADGTARTGGALDPIHAAGVTQPLVRTDGAAQAVERRLRTALERILDAAAADGVRVVLAIPATNLTHEPGHPLAGPGRSEADAAAADQWIAQARRAPGGQALAAWTEALLVDPHRADALHGWGMARLELGGDPSSAVRALRAAVDHDYAARRPTSAVRRALMDNCDRSMVTCVPLDAVLSERARQPIVPEDWFADHCHPSAAGTQQIGAVLAAAVVDAAAR